MSHDGNRVAIGAPNHNGNRGHVVVYEFDEANNSWIQLGGDINQDLALNDKFGYSVSLSSDGNWVACGANTGGSQNHGLVRVFQYVGDDWTKVGSDIIGETSSDQSGSSVSLSVSVSRKVVAVGAMHNDETATDSGHVRIYQLVGNAWTQLGSDIDGDGFEDFFGASISLSSDGQMAIIGAHEIIRDSGYASIYGWKGDNPSDPTSGAWELLEQIEGEAHQDQFGVSVSMSGDGLTV